MALPVVATTWEVVEDIQQAFNTFWLAEPIVTFLSWDNTPAEIASSGTDLTIVSSDPDVAGEGFTFLQVLHAAGGIAALGTKRFRQIGIVSASIYAETNKGRKRSAGKIADQALRFFQTELIAGVTFSNQRINEVGPDGRWWQVNVLADLLYDIERS